MLSLPLICLDSPFAHWRVKHLELLHEAFRNTTDIYVMVESRPCHQIKNDKVIK